MSYTPATARFLADVAAAGGTVTVEAESAYAQYLVVQVRGISYDAVITAAGKFSYATRSDVQIGQFKALTVNSLGALRTALGL